MQICWLIQAMFIYVCINETVHELLQLADGGVLEYDVVGPIEVGFKNRRCVVDAMVIPGDNELLLGVIPLEDTDVIIHPYRRE